jgi:hypothetical protein
MRKEKVSAKQLYLVEDNDTKELTAGRKMYNLCMYLLNNIPYSCYFAIVLCVALLSIYPYVAEDRVEEVKSGVLEYCNAKYDENFVWVGYSNKCERLYSRECRVSDGRVEFTVVVRYMRDGTIKYSDNYKEVLRRVSSGTSS